MICGVGAGATIANRAWRCTMKCLECGVKTAEATPACVVCGAPALRQSAASAWNGSPVRGKRYSVRQRRLPVKRDRAARANALAGPGGTEDSAAGPVDGDAAGWDVPAVIPASAGQQPPESAQDSEVDGAMLAEWVEARKFPITRLRPGYNEEEVDAFLDEVESRLAAQVSARCGAPVTRKVHMGCPYCDAFLRDGFRRRYWQWLTHPQSPVVEHRKKCLRDKLIVTTAILGMIGLIILAAALNWTVTGG
jgi:DivIVA domain-containing protein